MTLTAAEAEIAEWSGVANSTAAAAATSSTWDQAAARLKNGSLQVCHADLTNFQLRKVTSSFLAANAAYRVDDPSSRCGLKLNIKNEKGSGGADSFQAIAQYIVGGWSIGTVMDNSASRSSAGNGRVRTAPNSMAIQVNVNPEWKSADELHRMFGAEGLCHRGEPRVYEPNSLHNNASKEQMQKLASVELDRRADLLREASKLE